MKITQITSENTVSEAPGAGVLNKIGNTIKSKVGFTAGGRAEAKGKLQGDAKTKEIFTKWRTYLGTQGGNPY